MRETPHSDAPVLDAQLLACHILNISRTRLLAFPEQVLNHEQCDLLDTGLTRRVNGEPLAYIIGVREFWSTELVVTQNTLVPRPDTEILVEKALELATEAPDGYIVDLGTGTGAIVIAMAQELPKRQFIAVEKSAAALHIAQTNLNKHTAGNVQLVHANWLDSVAADSVAMVLANPPYLANNDPHLARLRHEPREALVSGNSGLEDLETIVRETARVGKDRAPLVLEHGCNQAAAVQALLLDYSYAEIDKGLDLAGLERISFGLVAKQSL